MVPTWATEMLFVGRRWPVGRMFEAPALAVGWVIERCYSLFTFCGQEWHRLNSFIKYSMIILAPVSLCNLIKLEWLINPDFYDHPNKFLGIISRVSQNSIEK